MAIIDNLLPSNLNQAVGPANTDQVLTNVYDAGAAVKLFSGEGGAKIACQITAVGGTTPNARFRFVGADNAALTSNPEILDDTGVSKTLGATDLPWIRRLSPNNQQATKRYYGVIFTQGGNADNTATVSAFVVLDEQSWLVK